jgi:hypothetical protein
MKPTAQAFTINVKKNSTKKKERAIHSTDKKMISARARIQEIELQRAFDKEWTL